MFDRIADSGLFAGFLRYIRKKESLLDGVMRKMSSGRKVNKPSDDVGGFVSFVRLKKISNSVDTYLSNINMVRSRVEVAESTLASVIDAAQVARVKILNLLNAGVITDDEAQIVRDYLEKIKEYIVNQANTGIGQFRLFGGADELSDPFTGEGVYQGSSMYTAVTVAKGVEIATNFNGADYLGVNYADNDNDGNPDRKILIVEVIDRIIDIIDNGNLDSLGNETISVDINNTGNAVSMKLLEAFDAGLSKIMQHRSLLGSDLEVMNDLEEHHQNVRLNVSQLMSDLVDIDYPEVIHDFERLKTAYEALVASVSLAKSMTFLKFRGYR